MSCSYLEWEEPYFFVFFHIPTVKANIETIKINYYFHSFLSETFKKSLKNKEIENLINKIKYKNTDCSKLITQWQKSEFF